MKPPATPLLSQSTFNDFIRKGTGIIFSGGLYPEGIQFFEKFMPCKAQGAKSKDKTCSNCKGKLKLVNRSDLICGRSSHKPNMMNLKIVHYSVLEDSLFDI